MVEEDLGPLSEWIFSLVEVSSLVEAACPLKQLLVFWCVNNLILVGSEVSVRESLFPRFHVLGAVSPTKNGLASNCYKFYFIIIF